MKSKLDKKLILMLYNERHTYADIGKIVGRSRQRIHQILRNYTTNKPKTIYSKLTISKCGICGNKPSILHHIDHDSHNNDPINFLPVCLKCHKEIHRGTSYRTIGTTYEEHICQWCFQPFTVRKGDNSYKKYCSNKCYGESQTLKNGQWSKKYSECIICHSTKAVHRSKGQCNNCYQRWWNRNHPRH